VAHVSYRARTLAGKIVQGRTHLSRRPRTDAKTDGEDIRVALSQKGLELIDWSEASPDDALPRGGPRVKRVRRRSLCVFTGQLALMLETGTAIVESLEALAAQTHDEGFRTILDAVTADVRGGSTLSAALEEHPRAFNRFYVSAVRSGEVAGNLVQVFKRLEDHLLKRESLATSILTALIYPAILAVLAVAAVAFLVTFVLPKFIAVFERNAVLLPLPTRMLLAAVGVLTSYWYVFVFVAVAIPAFSYWYLSRPGGKRVFDRLSLDVPLVGPLIVTVQTSVLLRMVGTLLDAGVPLLEAMSVAEDSCTNNQFHRAIARMVTGILRGEGLSANFSKSRLFPPAIKQMVATGERTGKLAMVMNKVADRLDDGIDKQLKKMSALIEPLVIIFMGSVIGFIAIAVLVPLFRLTSAVRGGG